MTKFVGCIRNSFRLRPATLCTRTRLFSLESGISFPPTGAVGCQFLQPIFQDYARAFSSGPHHQFRGLPVRAKVPPAARPPYQATATGAASNPSPNFDRQLQEVKAVNSRIRDNAHKHSAVRNEAGRLLEAVNRRQSIIAALTTDADRLRAALLSAGSTDDTTRTRARLSTVERSIEVERRTVADLEARYAACQETASSIRGDVKALRATKTPTNWTVGADSRSSLGMLERGPAAVFERTVLVGHMHQLGIYASDTLTFLPDERVAVLPDGSRVSTAGCPGTPVLNALLARLRQAMTAQMGEHLAADNFAEALSVLHGSQLYADTDHWLALMNHAAEREMIDDLLAVFERFHRETRLALPPAAYATVIERLGQREMWTEVLRACYWLNRHHRGDISLFGDRICTALGGGDKYAGLLQFVEASIRRGSPREFEIAMATVARLRPADAQLFKTGSIFEALRLNKNQFITETYDGGHARQAEATAFQEHHREARERYLAYLWKNAEYKSYEDFAKIAPELEVHSVDAEVVVSDAALGSDRRLGGTVGIAMASNNRPSWLLSLRIGQSSKALHAELAGVHAALLLCKPLTLKRMLCDNLTVCDTLTTMASFLRAGKEIDISETAYGPLFLETARLLSRTNLKRTDRLLVH
eukprot:TRINITY_DN3582_c0_g1_i1.p1 TRINITY_DN3582_c0_g1~~TRINITY_DN3582_c0_g1_i1.p1  ORF type:complete len:646 (-),score=120.97 TRINITY_DN3582_c0_g1_i1:61-1998(-)